MGARVAMLAPLAAVVVYLYGLGSMWVWDLRDTCVRHGESLDLSIYPRATYLPLSTKCNENFDLVPVWVNPALLVLVVTTVVCGGRDGARRSFDHATTLIHVASATCLAVPQSCQPTTSTR